MEQLPIQVTMEQRPEVPESLVPSAHDVHLLQPLYAGYDGETTAILQYIYQSYVTREQNETLGKILERIAISEMRHHEFLGRCIAMMGGKPEYGANHVCWTGAAVDYQTDPAVFLKQNIRAETYAIQAYEYALPRLENTELQEGIRIIIEEERLHILAFEWLLQNLNFLPSP